MRQSLHTKAQAVVSVRLTYDVLVVIVLKEVATKHLLDRPTHTHWPLRPTAVTCLLLSVCVTWLNGCLLPTVVCL